MIKFYFINFILIVIGTCNESRNFGYNKNMINTTIPEKKKVFFDSNLIGIWCYEVRDSINFSVNIVSRNDSVFCNYSNVMYQGKFLNANDAPTDWAFQLPITEFDTSTYIPIKNYYNDSIVHLAIEYKKNQKVLEWKIIESDYIKTLMLPTHVKLHRCTSHN